MRSAMIAFGLSIKYANFYNVSKIKWFHWFKTLQRKYSLLAENVDSETLPCQHKWMVAVYKFTISLFTSRWLDKVKGDNILTIEYIAY